MAVRQQKPPPKPLDAPALERLALRYVERSATTRAKLARYLSDKIRGRGWAGERAADPQGVANRMAELGYIDDRAFAEARARSLTRRGLGKRRVTVALRQAGVAEEDAGGAEEIVAEGTLASALAFARRRRIGPFGTSEPDRAMLEKQIGALVRAGHDFDLARKVARMAPGSDPELDEIEWQ